MNRLAQSLALVAALLLVGCATGGPISWTKAADLRWDVEAVAMGTPAPCEDAPTAYCVEAMRTNATRTQRMNRTDIISRLIVRAFPPHANRLLAGVEAGSVVRANGSTEAGVFTIHEMALPSMDLEQGTVGAAIRLAGQWLCPQLTEPAASAEPAIAAPARLAPPDDPVPRPVLSSCRNALTDTSIALARLQSYPQCRTQYADEAMTSAEQHFTNNPIR